MSDNNSNSITPNGIVLELKNVTKSFGKNLALDNISYQVRSGSVFALLGENGAGKTTTIRILLGLCEPESGSSTVLGLDSRTNDLKIRQSVGYVPEQPILYDWMTVDEIGRFTAAFYPPEFMNRYGKMAEAYGLHRNAKIKSLSKGMRAKVSLALALAHDPELLILDEPTSGLDALVRREFLESMVDRAATGRTVFLSSHQIAEVERVADTVAIMKKSQLLLVTPMEELKKTAHLITVTLKEETPFDVPLKTVIEERTDGRERRFLGHHLHQDAQQTLKEHQNVAKFEIRTPSLEEIFISYMGK
ncbi:MAG: ABC transporter ATP-binding protein [Planctomycetaceae bacterium]|jgi:ABC-2 type transport system ATP-binding protein|nr:ABC transporter ATP-binding protein [Planctomycetaceae bacterium]